jgi:predicted Zn-dependent peptidase
MSRARVCGTDLARRRDVRLIRVQNAHLTVSLRMKRPLLLFVTLALACKPLPPRGAVPVEVASGLPRLVLLRDDAQDRVVLSATVAAGSAYDPIGQEGLAFVTARAAVMPTTSNALPVQVDVGTERVRFEVACAPAEVERCADRLAGVLTTPRLDEVSRVVGRDVASFSMQGLPPAAAARASDALDRWIFQAHPYGHAVQGRAGTLPLFSTAALQAFWTRHVVRASTVIGVSGPVSGPQVEALMTRLRPLPTSLPPELVLMQPESFTGRALLVIDADAASTAVAVGAPLRAGVSDADDDALVVAFAAFSARGASVGGARDAFVGPASGGADTLGGVLAEPRQQGSWQVRAPSVAAGDAVEATRALLADLERLVRDGLTQPELDATRVALKAVVAARSKDPVAALDAATDALLAGTSDPLRLLPTALDALTVEQVHDALRRHVDPANVRVVVATSDAQALAAALKQTGAVGTGTAPLVDEVFVRSAADLLR